MAIPSNIRVPGVYVEVSNILAQSGLAQLQTRMLILGQMLGAGTAVANIPIKITSYNQAVLAFGRGSMLAIMFQNIFANNPYTEKWALPLADNGAGVAATGTITTTGPATETGVISLYVQGTLVSCLVTNGDAQNTITTNLAAAINANGDLPVTASAATNVVTITARNAGVVGNTIDLRLGYNGEVLPAGVACVIVGMASGATNPVITTALSNLPDRVFNFWVSPWIDSTTLGVIQTEINDRWTSIRQLDGHCLFAANGSLATVETVAAGYNNQHLTCFDAAFNSPTPPYIWASAVMAQVAYSASNDPALPFNTLPLIGVLPSPPQDERTFLDRQDLLENGVATHKVQTDGTVVIDRLITTYQTNNAGQPDASYLDANTLFTLSAFKQAYVIYMESNYSRFKLAANGTPISPNQNVITPKGLFGGAILFYNQTINAGWMQDIQTFKTQSTFDIDQSDPTKVDSTLVVTLLSGLQIIATEIDFKLQLGQGV